jgi:hypothetical protein
MLLNHRLDERIHQMKVPFESGTRDLSTLEGAGCPTR